MRWFDRVLVLGAAVVGHRQPLAARFSPLVDARAHDAFQSPIPRSYGCGARAVRVTAQVGYLRRARGRRCRERSARPAVSAVRTRSASGGSRRRAAAQGADGQRLVRPVLPAAAARNRARSGSRCARRAGADAARRDRAGGLRHGFPVLPQVSGRGPVRHRRLVAPTSSSRAKRSRSAVCPRSKRDVRGPTGSFTVIGVHLSAPTSPRRAAARKQELIELAARSAAVTGPLVVAGDFNITPYSPYFVEWLADSGLTDSRRGRTLSVSWPTTCRGSASPSIT